MEKYHVEWVFQSDAQKQKSKETCLKRYNAEFYTASAFFKNRKNRYFYDNTFFDSKPELCYYIWLKDNNVDFKYSPNILFRFTDKDGIEHSYHPDFLVNGNLVEIKGNHFFKADGTMCNPWKNRNWTKLQKEKSDDLYEAKHQCMLKNGVKIITGDEYRKYNIYVETKYGKKYLSRFLVKNHDDKKI